MRDRSSCVAPLLVVAALAATGCGDSSPHPADGGAPGWADLAGVDLGPPGACLTNPMTDGQACSGACPQGTAAVGNPGCNCWYACDPARPDCPCGRRCEALYVTGAGGDLVPTGGGACVPANGPGERCGRDGAGNPYGTGQCQQGTLCVNEDQAGANAYCMYECGAQRDCPVGTMCLPLQDGGTSVCAIDDSPMGKAAGTACSHGDLCAVAAECDGTTCRPQCDGPNDTTTCTGGGKCTALTDPANMRTAAWICR